MVVEAIVVVGRRRILFRGWLCLDDKVVIEQIAEGELT